MCLRALNVCVFCVCVCVCWRVCAHTHKHILSCTHTQAHTTVCMYACYGAARCKAERLRSMNTGEKPYPSMQSMVAKYKAWLAAKRQMQVPDTSVLLCARQKHNTPRVL